MKNIIKNIDYCISHINLMLFIRETELSRNISKFIIMNLKFGEFSILSKILVI